MHNRRRTFLDCVGGLQPVLGCSWKAFEASSALQPVLGRRAMVFEAFDGRSICSMGSVFFPAPASTLKKTAPKDSTLTQRATGPVNADTGDSRPMAGRLALRGYTHSQRPPAPAPAPQPASESSCESSNIPRLGAPRWPRWRSVRLTRRKAVLGTSKMALEASRAFLEVPRWRFEGAAAGAKHSTPTQASLHGPQGFARHLRTSKKALEGVGQRTRYSTLTFYRPKDSTLKKTAPKDSTLTQTTTTAFKVDTRGNHAIQGVSHGHGRAFVAGRLYL
jgi:hypothetical protein